ncbi:MAG TPA: succinate dehydrogenase, hydrophobic membrane anchor protein [Aliiroseovarius sp.]|nr:succinate dehydrogenase, hydrophobic membrane anchor protein [Aliiroseovarius sp.]
MPSYRTERAKVSGLGTARTGTGHFWEQRLSAIALLILTPFFVFTFARALGAPHEQVLAIYARPFNAIVAAGFVLTAMLHLYQGLTVVIEDYVHGRKGTILIIAVRLLCALGALTGTFAILKIAFTA